MISADEERHAPRREHGRDRHLHGLAHRGRVERRKHHVAAIHRGERVEDLELVAG